MDILSDDVKLINTRLDKHESEEKTALLRMEKRLNLLENEMRKTNLNKDKRDDIIRKERMKTPNSQNETSETAMNTRQARLESGQKAAKRLDNQDKDKNTPEATTKEKRKQYSRLNIRQEELLNISQEEEPAPNFKSTWAINIEKELKSAADKLELSKKNEKQENTSEKKNKWEHNYKSKTTLNCRNPDNIKHWFANESEDSESSSSASSSPGGISGRMGENRKTEDKQD